MSPRKEPLFFAPDLAGLPGDRIGDPDAYLALFKDATDQRRAGEASPYQPVLPARLGRDWPAVPGRPHHHHASKSRRHDALDVLGLVLRGIRGLAKLRGGDRQRTGSGQRRRSLHPQLSRSHAVLRARATLPWRVWRLPSARDRVRRPRPRSVGDLSGRVSVPGRCGGFRAATCAQPLSQSGEQTAPQPSPRPFLILVGAVRLRRPASRGADTGRGSPLG